jgi:hypothetical protein
MLFLNKTGKVSNIHYFFKSVNNVNSYKNCVTFLERNAGIFKFLNVKGYWNEKKEKLKQKYPILKDEDLKFPEGKEKEMIEMLGYKMGKTTQELLNIIVAL